MELREPLPGRSRRLQHRVRWWLAFLVLLPTAFELAWLPVALLRDDPDGALVRVPRIIGASVLLAIVVVAHLWFLHRARRARAAG
jgi:hypothetical protein